ncbi:RNA polymerase sigma factor FliA [Marinimicrobium sp. ABcell2]|uniref:RNA polymerase sigma factor FliA n=1 Tax=Marinimicrobium sp. ABcell2 TaxID=3069751 RepID=UPI0027B1E82A|nr:RNA polymerase sigma factor FliA [Marinimicrobium sp. ABcell2]MDQ2078077.1 RNA polymerase sigma factor FliA [Marinimicrobium sp. ABcell2]
MYDKTQQIGNGIRIEDHASLVKRIAYHMMLRMPASVQVDDLIQAGMIGLLEAAQKYDASRGASFETYAGIRIRGAIVDEMRRGDWAPRSVHRNARRVADAMSAVEGRTGRDAQDAEIAAELGVELDEYFAMLRDASASRLFSYEETFGDDEQRMEVAGSGGEYASPLENIQRDSLKQSVAQAITQLPEREQMVLALYYDEELNLKEIGQILGVSESRVSQIHSQAALRLRNRLSDWQNNN